MDRISVAVIDDIEETRNNIKALLAFDNRIKLAGEGVNGVDAVRIANEIHPDIILMDINMPVMDGIKATEEITLSRPEVTVIIMSVQGEQEYLKKAMSAGARDFISKPFSSEVLINTIISAHEMQRKRKEHLVVSGAEELVRSKVITVFSTKGGVGKTTIASNLAVSLARLTKKKVALVDLDLQFGDIAIMLNVAVKNTINDVIKEAAQLDSELMEDYLINHFSGVRILPAPLKPEYAEYITSSHVDKIIKLLKEKYHYIIVDTSASFHETVLMSLDMADTILFVSTQDLPTIKNVKSGMDVMDSLHYPPEKINIILNKASEQFGIKYKDFENTLKRKIWAYIPEDSQTVVTSANKGFPFVMTRTETKVAKAIIDMANKIANEDSQSIEERKEVKRKFGLRL
ncbi:MAG: response regulator [Bacillota bacterium]|nr:response regulator [Bacillota bacterium]